MNNEMMEYIYIYKYSCLVGKEKGKDEKENLYEFIVIFMYIKMNLFNWKINYHVILIPFFMNLFNT